MTPERFEAPWHAQIFALTVALNDAGLLSWPDWTEALGAALARRGTKGDADYYCAWLDALETVLEERNVAAPDLRESVRAAWEAAYLSTPHGRPVRLASEGEPAGAVLVRALGEDGGGH